MSGIIGIQQRFKQGIELDCSEVLRSGDLRNVGVTSSGSNGPLQANKKHSFHNWRGKERREALSIPGAERSPEGRGSEHGALLVYEPRGAAQAGLTGGADRSSRLRRETNVRKEEQPKAEPLNLEVENSVFSGHCLQQPRKQQELSAARVRDSNAAGKDECSPANSEVAPGGYPEASAHGRPLSSDWEKGRGHGKAGMESEEGTAF